MTAQRGEPAQGASDNRQRAAEIAREYFGSTWGEWVNPENKLLTKRIAEALDAAEERGRQSVGLGDFLPDPCGDEYSNYPWYIAATYGDYVTCTLRRGHDGQHEHEDSGMKWSTR